MPADSSFVLDVRVLVRQGLVRMGAFAPETRVRFQDPATGRAWGEALCAVDTRLPDAPFLDLCYELARSGERVALRVTLSYARGAPRGPPGPAAGSVPPAGLRPAGSRARGGLPGAGHAGCLRARAGEAA